MFCFKMAMGCSSPAAATATKVNRITCVQKLCKLGIRFAIAQRREPVKPISFFFFSPASCARLSNPWAVGVECAFHESAGLFIYRPVGSTQVWPPFVCPPPCPGTRSERKNWQLFLSGRLSGPAPKRRGTKVRTFSFPETPAAATFLFNWLLWMIHLLILLFVIRLQLVDCSLIRSRVHRSDQSPVSKVAAFWNW